MLESSSLRCPNSPASSISMASAPLSLPIPSDGLNPSPLSPCIVPQYSYAYLQQLSQHQALATNEYNLKSYFIDPLKQSLPEYIKQEHYKTCLPDHLKTMTSDHLKQMISAEHIRSVMMSDPLRLYLAQ
ncbi:hypothetical protein FHG87_011403, partial [Trinorchestia longiramus]